MTTSILEDSKKYRYFDERMIREQMLIMGKGKNLSVIIQPSMLVGYSYISFLSTKQCVWTPRPIRCDAIPMWLDFSLPKRISISWEFMQDASRVERPVFMSMERTLFD